MSLLAAILFPVFARVRENARRSTCQSNLKQVGLAVAQYVQDFDERMPPGRIDFPDATQMNWENMLQPYAKSYQVFRCPSNVNSKKDMDGDGSGLPANAAARSAVSYEAVTDAEQPWTQAAFGQVDKAGPLLSSFVAPSLTIEVAEANAGNADFSTSNDYFTAWSFTATNPFLFGGHLNTANFLFADGHVKALKPMATISGAQLDTAGRPGMGGSGSINMWARDGLNYTDQAPNYGRELTVTKALVQHPAAYYGP